MVWEEPDNGLHLDHLYMYIPTRILSQRLISLGSSNLHAGSVTLFPTSSPKSADVQKDEVLFVVIACECILSFPLIEKINCTNLTNSFLLNLQLTSVANNNLYLKLHPTDCFWRILASLNSKLMRKFLVTDIENKIWVWIQGSAKLFSALLTSLMHRSAALSLTMLPCSTFQPLF